METTMKFIVYYRTGKKRTPSLETQKASVDRIVSHNQGRVLAEYIENEVVVARRATARPQLQAAIEHALQEKAILILSHLDQLVRNSQVMTLLANSCVDFLCCDNPHANINTAHILAATAENQECKRSERMREKMAALKQAGVPLGSNRPGHWDGRERGWKQAVAESSRQRSERAKQAYDTILPEIKARRERGDTMLEIADWLNAGCYMTTAGKPFTETAIHRLIKRYLGDELLGNQMRAHGRQRQRRTAS